MKEMFQNQKEKKNKSRDLNLELGTQSIHG